MEVRHGIHLAYCTNVHPGEDWTQTFKSLEEHSLKVKQAVAPNRRYAIGLRLSELAARQLAQPATLSSFQKWLERNDCYVFTINGFPYGRFHGGSVKENVYRPDWQTSQRLEYTVCLFEILAKLLPADCEGSISTLPGSFKEFITGPEQEKAIRDNVWWC